jgi:prepilin-type N-terminal cleavage/methylation domain-containing protein
MVRRRPRGLSLVELVIVIAVIAILAAALVPIILNQVERTRYANEKRGITELAKALRRFKTDVGMWPYEDSVWRMVTSVAPDELSYSDTAMFVLPLTTPPLTKCRGSSVGVSCWGGPYLNTSGGYTGVAPDAWGRPRMVVYTRPMETGLGGTSSAPNGFISVWSRGPDGLDSYGCYNNGGCVRDLDRMASGAMSQPMVNGLPADDIVVVVGTAN